MSKLQLLLLFQLFSIVTFAKKSSSAAAYYDNRYISNDYNSAAYGLDKDKKYIRSEIILMIMVYQKEINKLYL